MQKKLIFLFALLFTLAANPVFAATPAFHLIPDSSIVFRDSSVTVYLLTDAESVNLKAYSLEITFNRSIVRANELDVVEGALLGDPGEPTFFWVGYSVDSSTLYIDGAILGDGVVVSGSGILAVLTLHSIGFGSTDLAFTSIRARDGLNNPLVYDGIDGWIKVCQGVGDVNADNRVNISDCVYLINWIFGGGPSPIPEPLVGDVNCSGFTNISDVVYIINYIFSGGPAPCGPCY